jgi:Zn-dependent protease with chaperone function
MNLALIVAGLALVALPGWTASLGRRLVPREWARLTVASLSVGLLAVHLGLVMTAAPTLLGAVGGHDLAQLCHQALSPLTPGGAVVGSLSAIVLVTLDVRMLRARRHSRRARRRLRVESWIGDHADHSDHEFVIIPTTAACAYALQGEPPQVVVSEGLADALSSDELAAVVRHEQSHLRHGHQRQLDLALATDVVVGFLPAARRSTAVLRLALERWADEEAAGAGNRATVRGALEKVLRSMLPPLPVPTFTSSETIRHRLEALDHEPERTPRRWQFAAMAPVGVLLVVVGLAFVCSGMPLHDVFHALGL